MFVPGNSLVVVVGDGADVCAAWCEIELSCAACIPEAMPRVAGAAAAGGALRAAPGAELRLACGGGAFLAYPARAALRVRCEAGRYRVLHDQQLRHLLELGCQESVFEDVLHQVLSYLLLLN